MLFWIISQRILPPVVTIIPVYMMFQSVRLLDTHIALILCYTVVNLPIAVWLMYGFFNTIPIDLEESAQLDGASRWRCSSCWRARSAAASSVPWATATSCSGSSRSAFCRRS
jgi:ABC-type glycerol-3-phosphate transport system permease component